MLGELPPARTELYRQLEEQRELWLHGGPVIQHEAMLEIDHLLDCMLILGKLAINEPAP